MLKKKNSVCQDDPSCADEYSVQLKDSDIIVSGTDGVFDNLFTHEILKIVSLYRARHKNLFKDSQANELAQIIVDAAR